MQLLSPFLLLFTLFNAAINSTRALDFKIQSVIVVDKSGKGNFKTIQAAIDSVPLNNNKWVKIQVNPGVYREKVTITSKKPFIFLQGGDRNTTIITFNDHQQTDTSATFSSIADNIIVRGITFQNSFNLANAPQLFVQSAETFYTQALAARIYGDKSAFINCGFKGFQDTLWDVKGRHYFKSCYIEGAIDFIFGNGQSVYEGCLIYVNVGLLPEVNQGYITAQGRQSAKDLSGFVFKQCTIMGSGKAFLGRAYGPFSRVVFEDTNMGNVVAPEGWNAWNFRGKEKNFMYIELNSRGIGSSPSKRVPWAKTQSAPSKGVSWAKTQGASQLNSYSVESFINQDGWIPKLL